MINYYFAAFLVFVLVYALISLIAQSNYIKNLEKENENASKLFIEAIEDLTKKLKE